MILFDSERRCAQNGRQPAYRFVRLMKWVAGTLESTMLTHYSLRVLPWIAVAAAGLAIWGQTANAQPSLIGRSKDPIQGAVPGPRMDEVRAGQRYFSKGAPVAGSIADHAEVVPSGRGSCRADGRACCPGTG